MASPRFQSVEEYFASLDPAKGKTLRSVIHFILDQFPELESKIAWNVPVVHRQGKYVFGVSASKNHLTLAPWSPRVLDGFRKRLGKLIVKQKCFQVPVDWAIDTELVGAMIRAQLKEMD